MTKKVLPIYIHCNIFLFQIYAIHGQFILIKTSTNEQKENLVKTLYDMPTGFIAKT